ncbi:hypothetical protein [uncultured Tateyamaria sp.]|uniref:hypothetical protein n=1 Tax=uncultured Tateyamaria sp. TaxID=455651 RepID=UPI002604005B|nr:hypothetical protein [uncultured Tateyamaria sp.]
MVDAPKSSEKDAHFKIRLFGPFVISLPDGSDATPAGRKAKALVALLALAPTGRRARSWLQDRLWSGAAGEKGAASLRQELSGLRRHFASFGHQILDTSGDDVLLDMRLVWLDFRDGMPDPHRDLLEGLDVRDPEFEDWLSEERAHWYARLDEKKFNPSAKPGVHLHAIAPPRGIIPKLSVRTVRPIGEITELETFSETLSEDLMASFHALAGAICLVEPGRREASDYELVGTTRSFRGFRVHMRLIDLNTGIQLWSARYEQPDESGPDGTEKLARKIVEEIQRILCDGRWADYWAGTETDTIAWELFQKGRVCETAAQRNALASAIEYYRGAIEADPKFVQARISLGFCLIDGVRLCLLGAPTEAVCEAYDIADEVTRAEPDNAYGNALRAFILCAKGQASDAVGVIEAVAARMPASPEWIGYVAAVHGYNGNFEREQALCRHAMTLSEFPPLWIRTNLALSLLLSEKGDPADLLKSVLAAQPNHVRALIAETVRLVRHGDLSAARLTADRLLIADPDFRAEQWRSKAFVSNPILHRRLTKDLRSAGIS